MVEENNHLKNIQKETEDLQIKLQESEAVLQIRFVEIQNLQAKSLETDKRFAEKSNKFEQDIKALKEILQDKENSISDYQTAVDLLQNSRKQLELDVSNQKQDFSEKEAKLLDEIREIKVGFEIEKTKILKNNFQEKEEMKIRIEKLEMLLDQHNVDMPESNMDEKPYEFECYEGVGQDNSLEEPMDIRGYEGIDRNYSFEERRNDDDVYGYHDDVPKRIMRNEAENLGDPKGYRGVNVVRSAAQCTRNEVGQYEEINYYPVDDLGHLEEGEPEQPFEEKYKQGLKTLRELKHEVLQDEYKGIGDEFGPMTKNMSHESLFSEDKYKEIGGEESLELLKYEHEIDLLLERKENERLRDEIKTLTNCVDVFHDECESLKRSLDKTLNVVKILREERDKLMKENDLNMIEHSELVLDLIKYEETISRLEKGNEKLEDDKEVLAESLKQRGSIVSREVLLENEAGISKSAKNKHSKDEDESLERHTLYSNHSEVFLSTQRGPGVDDYQQKDPRFLRENDRCQRNYSEARRRGDARLKRVNKLLGDSVERVEWKSRSLVDIQPANEDMRKLSWPQIHEEIHCTQRSTGDNLTSTMPRFETSELKDEIHEKHKNIGNAEEQKMLHTEQVFRNDFVSTMTRMGGDSDKNEDGKRQSFIQEIKENKSFPMKKSKNGSQNEFGRRKQLHEEHYTASHHPRKEENRGVLKSPASHKEIMPLQVTASKLLGLKTASTQTPGEENRRSKFLEDEKNTRQFSKTSNVSIMFPRRDEPSCESPKHSKSIKFAKTSSRSPKRTSKRFEYGTTDHQKSVRSSSRFFSPKVKNPSRTPVSNISALNSSKFLNSSILTSTKENLTTPKRLFPNLTGLSPIVSPLDRHYQSEKLKWQISEETPKSRDNSTTFLLNEDPDGLPTKTPKRKGFYSNSSNRHTRSRSADDRLLTSSREITRDLHLEKPLVINFEDFVFRHRVKSSEDVANIRDPSPAELWFS